MKHKKTTNKQSIIKNTAILIIFTLAIMFRLKKWSFFNDYSGDEGIQLITINHLLKYGKIPISGPISSINIGSPYIIHNSSLGFYFQTLLYILCGQNTKNYTLIYTVLNLISLILIYKTTKILFSKKTAIATLIFMSFSPLMIWISVWPSQPSNAIFFQIISIYLATLAYKKKKKKLISWAVVTSLISVQLYPPMYLLIPTQLIIFYKFFWPKIKQKKKFIQKIILSAFIIYLPLIIFEIISQYANFNTIINFVKNSAQQPNNKNIYQNIQTNIKDLYGFIHWKIPTQKYFKYFFYPSISGLIYLLIKKNKNHPKHIIILSYILLPILLVSLIQEKINNVYIFSLAPIIFVLLGDIISTVSNKIYYPCITLITILYILVTYQELFKYKPINKLQQSKDICQTIINTNKKHNISDNNFSLFTIDPSNSWNWNGPFYWHLLEKTTNKKLINLNPYTSRSETINPQPSFLYLICEQNTGDSCVKTYSTQKQINKIKIISKWNFINSQVFLIKST